MYFFILLPCSFQSPSSSHLPPMLSWAKSPFQSEEAKLYRLQQTGREMEWKKSGIKEERGRREVEGKGSVAAAAASRLNDVFQEEQSSLSNRRLRNELAYLFGWGSGEMSGRAVSYSSIKPNNAIVSETE